MSSFDDAFEMLMDREGGYSNNPADPGGETMFGVTARVARASGYTGPMRDLPRDTAKGICKRLYWDPLHLDDVPPVIGFTVLDANYNGGHPVLWMQQAAGAKADGVLGPATLAAVCAVDPLRFVMRFTAVRQSYFTACKAWASFGRGWINRTSLNLIIGAR
jgi:lysozyme family protein